MAGNSKGKIRAGIMALLQALSMLCLVSAVPAETAAPVSVETAVCLECHETLHPGIVRDWRKSRHALTTPGDALRKEGLRRKVSSTQVPQRYKENAVGCAECHTMRAASHGDSFEHNDFPVHPVVTPKDCAACHSEEHAQYGRNLMAYARINLLENPLYMDLVQQINGSPTWNGTRISISRPERETNRDSCSFCHGTLVEMKGLETRETDMGEMSFPVLSGWPNHGVGRFNPDGTKGTCAACHTRHRFSIAMARKPHTCSECHKGPDVPAYAVYRVSKMGNVYAAQGASWDFNAVPWKVGRDFSAPTCAACHVSLLTGAEGQVLAERTHTMSDRLPWRLLGLVYAHPHPASPDTSRIKTPGGLSLPTDLEGKESRSFLISPREMADRRRRMMAICGACHARSLSDGHFRRLEHTGKTTNRATLAATGIMRTAWREGLAKGPDAGDSPFNEPLEKKWVEQWLFYANSVRLATAMGGADYGVFANGRWYLSRNIREMQALLEDLRARKAGRVGGR